MSRVTLITAIKAVKVASFRKETAPSQYASVVVMPSNSYEPLALSMSERGKHSRFFIETPLAS